MAFVSSGSNWSQSAPSNWNWKLLGIGSTAHGFAFSSKPPISRPPTSSSSQMQPSGSRSIGSVGCTPSIGAVTM